MGTTMLRLDTPDTAFVHWLNSRHLNPSPKTVDSLWLNITSLCNQRCAHCHVRASPDSGIHMTDDIIQQCLRVLEKFQQIRTVDLTGGAPELHPGFERIVGALTEMGKKVVVRHNLTVTLDGNPVTGESKLALPQFFADNQVEILASLPYLEAGPTDAVRGRGVFRKSIESLRLLNAAGYGTRGLALILVVNSDQPLTLSGRIELEQLFKSRLGEFGIMIDGILTVTNLIIGRHAVSLRRRGRLRNTENSLRRSAIELSIERALCRSRLSVGIDGRLYDCDFNFALGLPVGDIFAFDLDRLLARDIRFGEHCYGCIAGAGSG
ncbi:radical SAM/Cys-rich domain-containing protein [Dehalogenimonas formicexedens]|uniref:Radical SAM/Cys-rich domain-containing protein n=1 Tax=Dehalogenimonas formicexedens TaxID=1839801 RepID=A0A1P8F667_9CHLR|nr:DUF3641 domain-containing protein [Dehalogenimonas formicexedens]APV43971.1 radical SAM/Cys-rich domain-containing protein [Dehalogenimonas formicexedens]